MTIGIEYYYQQANGLYPVPQQAVDDACAHALADFPNESCGIVFGGKYYPMPNVHASPVDNYDISLKDQNKVCRPDQVESVLHSHPQGGEGPTASDMQSQINAAIPYGVIVIQSHAVIDVVFFGDSVPMAPAEGRPFKNGVYDCYSTSRDYYRRECGLVLPDCARDADWWNDPNHKELLEEDFERIGFHPIGVEALQPGDGFLAKPFRTLKVCHCGIYLGNSLILHHFGSQRSGRMSVIEPIYGIQRFITQYIRYKDGVQPSASKKG